MVCELELDPQETVDWARKWLLDFNAGKTQLVLFDRSNNTGAIGVKMNGSVLEEKSSCKLLALTFSSKLDWGSYVISIAKIASRKIGTLIRSMKFLSPDIALYLYKPTIWPCMQYCCHVWAGAPSCYLELSYMLQKGYIGLVVLHLLRLLNLWLIFEIKSAEVFAIDITLADIHLNWLNLFQFLIREGGLLVILIDCMVFLLPFVDVQGCLYEQFLPSLS